MAETPRLSRAEMEQAIREGGSVLLPAVRAADGRQATPARIVRALEDLPADDQLARRGLADPQAALAAIRQQQADLARREADLLATLPAPGPGAGSAPEEAPPATASAPAETAPEEVPPVEAVTSDTLTDDPLDAPSEEAAEERSSVRKRRNW